MIFAIILIFGYLFIKITMCLVNIAIKSKARTYFNFARRRGVTDDNEYAVMRHLTPQTPQYEETISASEPRQETDTPH